ncbi:MAG TPA: anthranilate synthase component I, partial [Verrucomicrobiales bacterium]|nr:anthranilate synthase component I [Verrucomicrobiales bacterium]
MFYPETKQFIDLAEKGNLIPVTRTVLADFDTPCSAYQKLRGQGESFLFESVEGGEHLGRYSFVGCNPRAVIKQKGDQIEVIQNGKVLNHYQVVGALASSLKENEVRDGLEAV